MVGSYEQVIVTLSNNSFFLHGQDNASPAASALEGDSTILKCHSAVKSSI